MTVKQTLTLEDVLTTIGINYEGVAEAVIEIASESQSTKEFWDKFHDYYSENGLGGDDTWMDCETYLWLVLGW